MTDKFNADALLESFGLPEIVINGKSYIGKPLSVVEWFEILARIDNLKDATNAKESMLDIYQHFIYKMFSPPKWKFWTPNPAKIICEQPTFLEIANRFFTYQMGFLPTNPSMTKPN